MSMGKPDTELQRCDHSPSIGGGISRRTLLRGALAAAGAGIVGAATARAQVTGIMPGGGKVPFRLPLGALPYLDRKQYIKNMDIVSYLPGATVSGGEPLMVLWARGRQRLLPAGGGWVDISDPRKPVFVKTPSRIQGCVVYNTRLKKWIMMSSAGAPLTSATPEFPYGQYETALRAKWDTFTGLRGIRTYDVTDPLKPVLLQEFSTGATGMGTHHNFYDGGKYAYLECGWDESLRMENAQRPFSNGLMIVDMTDPANVKEVARWWAPGQRYGEEEEYKKYPFAGDQSSWTGNHGSMSVPKRPEDGGTVGYAGFGAFGMYVMDLTDITKPKPYGKVRYEYETMGGIPYHTVYPIIADPAHPQLQHIVLGIPETIQADCREPYKIPYVIDVRDPRNPKIIGLFPRPAAPEDAPYADFCLARGRFGSHNTQAWLAPGTARPEVVAISWFVAGLRVFDLTTPAAPREVAWFVPPRDGEIEQYETWWRGTSENVFVEWDRNLIWLGTHAGTYCLSTPVLGKPVLEPRRIERWSVAHCNVGWDDQTPVAVYLGRSCSQLGERG
jgi:hypothetical protein